MICFTKIARNITSYVFVKGWQAFVRYRGQIQTCIICGDIDHLAKDCPRAKRQNKPSQPSSPDTPMETQETPKPPKPVISQEETMNTPGESAQGSPLISEPNSLRIVMNTSPSLTQVQKKWSVPRPYRALFNPSFDLNTLL